MAAVAGGTGCDVRYHLTNHPVSNNPMTIARNNCSCFVRNFTP